MLGRTSGLAGKPSELGTICGRGVGAGGRSAVLDFGLIAYEFPPTLVLVLVYVYVVSLR